MIVVMLLSGYAGVDNLKLIVRLEVSFVTTLKSNRLVSVTPDEGSIHLQDIPWTAEQLGYGLSVKLNELPFRVQLFKGVATNGDLDWMITHPPEGTLTTHAIQEENAVRWHIEPLPRELKPLTGSEKWECRKARSQRNPLGCCYHAWLALRLRADQLGQSLSAVQHALFDDYLRAELRHPPIPAFSTA